jgi:hypothetical protein
MNSEKRREPVKILDPVCGNDDLAGVGFSEPERSGEEGVQREAAQSQVN